MNPDLVGVAVRGNDILGSFWSLEALADWPAESLWEAATSWTSPASLTEEKGTAYLNGIWLSRAFVDYRNHPLNHRSRSSFVVDSKNLRPYLEGIVKGLGRQQTQEPEELFPIHTTRFIESWCSGDVAEHRLCRSVDHILPVAFEGFESFPRSVGGLGWM